MLVSELFEHTLKEHDADTRKAVRAALTGSGFKFCGSGDDSLVFTKDGNTIIKVIVPNDIRSNTQQNSEQSYRKFLDFCAKVQRSKKNPHLPEVKELPRVNVGGLEFAQYEMPKYRPLSSDEYDVIDDMGTAISRRKESFKQFLHDAEKDPDYTLSQLKFISKQESLYRVLTALTRMAGTIGFTPDITGHNVMKKADGTLVVIDPWQDWSNSPDRR